MSHNENKVNPDVSGDRDLAIRGWAAALSWWADRGTDGETWAEAWDEWEDTPTDAPSWLRDGVVALLEASDYPRP